MYTLFIILFIVLVITILLVNYNSFQMKEHKFWLASLITINISLFAFVIYFYFKKTREGGATGLRGYKGDDGADGEDFNSCSNNNNH